ncbi:DUF2177 domain-containing protein [Litorivita pollutaquae]|uniref:DUF2177 domain-containing protein n=1 Tax=Litorivita pollutaquae TaxID=2200892 RepID=A0A2V4NET3_9RHOB|nr:DUF2177 family protein [Litorivita pollutaquae]PYC48853.1 DUF2177 domain-containing protein [Litorivita pollutaquae]
MPLIILYISTAIIFLGLDAVMLKNVMRPLFETRLGDQLLDDLRLGAAALFYLAYVGGVLYFVSAPALRDGGALGAVFLSAAILGAMAYGTYEFTNFATLKAWDWRMVAVDLTWGAALTGTSAALGLWITRAVT